MTDLSPARSSPTLGELGYTADPGNIEREAGWVVWYHYTHPEHLGSILDSGGGLRAVRQEAVRPIPAAPYIVQGFLNLQPDWLEHSTYFGDLVAEIFDRYIGKVPLRVRMPATMHNAWVADGAHMFECKHLIQRGSAPLGLSYDCANGRDAMCGWLRSHIPLAEYTGGHICPIVNIFMPLPDVLIPSTCIELIGDRSAT